LKSPTGLCTTFSLPMSARHLGVRPSNFSSRYRPKPDALWKSPQKPVVTAAPPSEPAEAEVTTEAPHVMVVGRLGPDAWAELLRFVELWSLGSVAVVCTTFCKCTFEDIRFWMAYAGLGANHVALTSSISPGMMRSAVRRVAFGLEGSWGKAFSNFAADNTSIKIFTEATRMLSGIRKEDDELETARFIGVLVGKLGTFDASCKQTRQAAQAAVEKAHECEMNLPSAAMPFARAAPPLKRLRMALEASIRHWEASEAKEPLISAQPSPPELAKKELMEELLQERDEMEEDPEDAATEISTCDDRILRTGLVAAATAAGALATSFLSEELLVDEGMQEFTVLAALIPAGFIYARRRQQAAARKASAAVSKLLKVKSN